MQKPAHHEIGFVLRSLSSPLVRRQRFPRRPRRRRWPCAALAHPMHLRLSFVTRVASSSGALLPPPLSTAGLAKREHGFRRSLDDPPNRSPFLSARIKRTRRRSKSNGTSIDLRPSRQRFKGWTALDDLPWGGGELRIAGLEFCCSTAAELSSTRFIVGAVGARVTDQRNARLGQGAGLVGATATSMSTEIVDGREPLHDHPALLGHADGTAQQE